jgi:outer membrane protein assembly factor BamB
LFSGLAISLFAFGAHQARAWDDGGFNEPGNVLISDQFNNRVIEVDRNKNIVWTFGSGDPTLCNPGPGAIIGLNDAERLSDGLTLLAGTGIPPGASSLMPAGCVDNRVIVVNQSGKIVWQFGTVGPGSPLNVPVFAIQLPNHNFLITDQSNERVIEVNRFTKKIVWQYGQTGVTGSGFDQLNNPNSAELLPNGHILIADENNNRAIEVTRSKKIVWQVGPEIGLNLVAFASRLPNGHTLITDSGNNRIVEVTHGKQIVFDYPTNTEIGSNTNPLPTNAVQLKNGDISIADQFNHRALIIDRDKSIDFQYGMLNVAGNGPDQTNGPYTAFVIDDYTGQTPPPEDF